MAARAASIACPARTHGDRRPRPEPDSRDPSGYDASLRSNASPGAVAYRIHWRDTWTNDWQRRQTVGNATQFVLSNISIDDFVFGIAAIGADGHESLISAYVSAIRQDPEVKVIK